MVQVTYVKRNGDILRRTIRGYTPYRIGDINSYGWKVTDVKYQWKDNKYYSRSEYDRLVNKSISLDRKISKYKRAIERVYKELAYIFYLLMIARVFQVITK